jgi:hypothetical protein
MELRTCHEPPLCVFVGAGLTKQMARIFFGDNVIDLPVAPQATLADVRAAFGAPPTAGVLLHRRSEDDSSDSDDDAPARRRPVVTMPGEPVPINAASTADGVGVLYYTFVTEIDDGAIEQEAIVNTLVRLGANAVAQQAHTADFAPYVPVQGPRGSVCVAYGANVYDPFCPGELGAEPYVVASAPPRVAPVPVLADAGEDPFGVMTALRAVTAQSAVAAES